ncbi:amidohydrolase family protein, partial [bacterium]|nr:amidohydrolase family protein [bacterium]
MQRLTALVFLLVVAAICLDPAVAQTSIDSRRPPIIDMHLHAFHLDDGEPPAVNPVTGRPSAARTSAELRDMSLAELERYNIVKAVASGPPETIGRWREAAPDRIMVGAFVDEASPLPDLARLRAEIQAGRVHVLGELILQHRGMAPNDPCMEPYYALAEEMDIPVGIHTGIGPPGTPYDPCCP